ncbi:MAG: diacylglycerol kinase family lipid kinase [Opitutae bacterium]|nr:diacylglycerol kinase family lipid kinase [Opitutae bacterium]
MKIRFILNPASGHLRRRPQLAGQIRGFCAARGLDATLAPTERAGHAPELAATAVREGCDVVVAVGGDGTMNEVASALVGTRAALGLVPCGSGNGLARHLGMPLRPAAALETLLSGKVRLIDSGVVNGLPFFNAMGLGFEAEIAAGFAKLKSRGLAGYFRVGWPLFFSHREETCRVTHDAGTSEFDHVFTLAVLNSDQYGNDAVLAPGAKVDDGRFDLVTLRKVGFARAAALLWRMRFGGISRAPELMWCRSSRFVIERQAPAPFHTDGEPRPPAARLEITLRPKSLRILVPTARPT